MVEKVKPYCNAWVEILLGKVNLKLLVMREMIEVARPTMALSRTLLGCHGLSPQGWDGERRERARLYIGDVFNKKLKRERNRRARRPCLAIFYHRNPGGGSERTCQRRTRTSQENFKGHHS